LRKKLYIDYDVYIIDNLSYKRRGYTEQLKIIEILKSFIKLKLNGGFFNYGNFFYNTLHYENKLLHDFWIESSEKYDFITIDEDYY
jgi:hypothetical protein